MNFLIIFFDHKIYVKLIKYLLSKIVWGLVILKLYIIFSKIFLWKLKFSAMSSFSFKTNVFVTFSHAAGVFLIVRCSSIYEYAVNILEIISVIGSLTAFFAATVGLIQNDLKRVVAYSTCSQLLRPHRFSISKIIFIFVCLLPMVGNFYTIELLMYYCSMRRWC